ncbi:MAG: hypothetical protein NTZ34_05095 [Chloroflexi bacterium]|nr:hypothetical protein [Chloroflexota bacterium]
MPFKCVYNFVSELCNGQKGEAPLAILFPLGILAIGFIVLYAVFGSTLYSANQDSATAGNNPAIYQAGPGAFSPVTNLEKFTEQNHERAYSTLKGAIADLNSTNTDPEVASWPTT